MTHENKKFIEILRICGFCKKQFLDRLRTLSHIETNTRPLNNFGFEFKI